MPSTGTQKKNKLDSAEKQGFQEDNILSKTTEEKEMQYMKAGRDQAYKQAGQSAMGRSKANYDHDGAKARLLATKWVIMSGRCKEDPIRK